MAEPNVLAPYEAPESAPAIYEPTATSPNLPETVQIGGEALPLVEVEKYVNAGRNAAATLEQAEGLLERNQTAVNIAAILDKMAPNTQQFMVSALEYAMDCEAKGLPLTSVDEAVSTIAPEFKGPQDYTRVPTTQMSDEAATVAEEVHALKYWVTQQIKAQSGLLQGVQQQNNAILQQVHGQTAAQAASRKLGVEITPQMISDYAKDGIDLLKAIQSGRITGDNIVKGSSAPTNGAKPISAPPPGKQTDFIDPDERDPAKIDRLWREGVRYQDAAVNKLYAELHDLA